MARSQPKKEELAQIDYLPALEKLRGSMEQSVQIQIGALRELEATLEKLQSGQCPHTEFTEINTPGFKKKICKNSDCKAVIPN